MSDIGRNDPCHCGSGKKYKKCHIDKDEKQDQKNRQKAALNAAKVAEKNEEKEGKESSKEKKRYNDGAKPKKTWLRSISNKISSFSRKSP